MIDNKMYILLLHTSTKLLESTFLFKQGGSSIAMQYIKQKRQVPFNALPQVTALNEIWI